MSREFKNRQNPRLKHFDYAQHGAYFVTICTHNRECLFGEVLTPDLVDFAGSPVLVGAGHALPTLGSATENKSAVFVPNELGNIVEKCWMEIPEHFSNIELGTFVIMPNHFHGIVLIKDMSTQFMGRACPAPTKTGNGLLSTMIGSFKSAATKQINIFRNTPEFKIWQRGFHERIIRDENEYQRICDYIRLNPENWDNDKENPVN